MANEEIASAFREIGRLLELKGESLFQVRAYGKAADRLVEAGDLAELIREGKLTDIPGIGKAMAEKIGYFMATGAIPQLEELRREIPQGVIDLAGLSGLGPGRVRKLRDEIGVESVEALEAAIQSGQAADIKGFGPKLLKNLRSGIDLWKRVRGLRLHMAGRREAEEIVSRALESGAPAAAPAGGIARGMETIDRVTVVIAIDEPAPLLNRLAAGLTGTDQTAETLCYTGRSELPIEIITVPPARFGGKLLLLTGSAAHLEQLKPIAETAGVELSGLSPARGDAPLEASNEAEAYQALGLPMIPPELREGRGEIEAAQQGRLPRLLESPDIRGLFHMHSTWSDGKATIEEMAEHAISLGLEYIGLADHSRSAGYAGGLSPDRLRAQSEEVARLNEKLAPFRIFHGIESDILAEGELDYEDELLGILDFVVASIHSRFGLEREAQTARLIRAVQNPHTTILGHSSGRLLLAREPYEFDSEAVWDAARTNDTVIELNAHEKRLDVDWRDIPAVRERHLLISIGPDAHDRRGLETLDMGIRIARKGWLTKEAVLNTMGRDEVTDWLGERKKRTTSA